MKELFHSTCTLLFFWNLSKLLFFFHTFFGLRLPLQILGCRNHSTIKVFSFQEKDCLSQKNVPFILNREFFEFRSATTSACIQLEKLLNYQNVKLFKLVQPCTFQLFQIFIFSPPKKYSGREWENLQILFKTTHLSTSSCTSYFELQTPSKELQYFELFSMYSAF